MTLFAMLLFAVGVAFLLSPPAKNVRAWDQSPVSPVSPPAPTQALKTPTSSPTVAVVTLAATPENPISPEAQLPQRSRQGSNLLVAGGIALAGLAVGAAFFFIRGEPSDEMEL
jgi:hypothetical protein